MVTGGALCRVEGHGSGLPELLPLVRHVLQADHADDGIAGSSGDKGATQSLLGRLVLSFSLDDLSFADGLARRGIIAGDVAEHPICTGIGEAVFWPHSTGGSSSSSKAMILAPTLVLTSRLIRSHAWEGWAVLTLNSMLGMSCPTDLST